MDYYYTGCMLDRASRTKETLPDFFCGNMDPDNWNTTMWYRITRNPQEFHKLTGCQRDPRDRGATAWYQSIGTRVPRA